MIEMHQDDDDALGDDPGSTVFRPHTGLFALAFSPAAMAIASLLTSLAALTEARSAEVVGQAVLFSSKNPNNGEVTDLRGQAFVQLIIAVVALVVGLAAAVRVAGPSVRFTDGPEDEEVDDGDPLWVRAAAGAAILLAVIAIVVSAGALIEAEHVHLAKQFLVGD